MAVVVSGMSRAPQTRVDLSRHVAEARELLDALREAGEHEAEVLETAVEGETDLAEAIGEAVRRVREAEAMMVALDVRQADIEARREALKIRVGHIKAAVLQAMEIVGLPRLPTPEGTVYVAAGRPGVTVTDPDELPDDLVTVKTSRRPNLAAIRAALDCGVPVPGAAASNGAPYIAIRR